MSSDMPDKIGGAPESWLGLLVRIDETNDFPEPRSYDLDWPDLIGVICHDSGDVVLAFVSVGDEMRSEVSVRSFLLGIENTDEARTIRRRRHQRPHPLLCHERAEDDLDVRQRSKGTNVDFLPDDLARIGGSVADHCREVLD